MAVEASRIKGRFKELFPKANLSNKRLDAIAARLAKKPADDADDAAIDVVLNEANEVYPFEEIARDEHRAINAENKLKKALASSGSADEEDNTEDSTQDTDPPEKIPAWAKRMEQNNATLLEKIAALETGKVIESKRANAKKLFDSNQTLSGLKETVKEKWLNRINVESETSIEDQIADLETEYTELVQTTADGKRTVGAPPNGFASGKPTDAELDAVAESL